jgi:pimeloyl-ACP methyl ester carboxylesterase
MSGDRGARRRRRAASMSGNLFRLVLIAAVAFGLAASGVLALPTQPEQPTTGPGSSEYLYGGVIQSAYGSGSESYYLFEPTDPTPDSAPVVAFIHAFSGEDPIFYDAWINHIVRRGNIVVFPRFQRGFLATPRTYTPSVQAAMIAAYEELETGDHVRPDPEDFAIVGHSVGAVIAANLAVTAVDVGLPEPKALMIAHAADIVPFLRFRRNFATILLEDYGTLPADMLLLGAVGARDSMAGDYATLVIVEEAVQIPLANREVVELQNDYHGYPSLKAGHIAPNAGTAFESTVDAYDYYGYWKWFDGLTDAAFYGINREYALGNTPEQTYMGQWSDGTPVTPAEVVWPAP